MEEKIVEIIDNKVRPVLEEHHGNIEFVKLENLTVYVKLLGKCSGCPSARSTLEDVVLGRIREEFEEIKDVVLINDISQDIINMARKILKI